MARKVGNLQTPESIRDDIVSKFPWVVQPNQNMVIGCDLDALLSAAFMFHHFNWKPIGVYNLKAIYVADGFTNMDVKNAVWVDLDIARADIKSIGHHILTNRADEILPEHAQSLNPNLLRGRSVGQFARKYPLSTQMLLMWLTGKPAPGKETDPYLIWLPDSCWITAQYPEKYLPNVRDWITNWMPHSFLVETVELPQTQEYEQKMRDFMRNLAANSFLGMEKGQTHSKWYGLKGHQCNYDNPVMQNEQVEETLNYLAQLSEWEKMPFPKEYRVIPCVQKTIDRQGIDLAEFIVSKEIFSYAIISRETIKFTSFKNQ